MLDSLLVSQSKSLLVDISFEDAELGDQHMINKVTGKALNETMFKTNRGAPRVMDHPVYGRVFYPNGDRFWWSRDLDLVGIPTCTVVVKAALGESTGLTGYARYFMATGGHRTSGYATEIIATSKNSSPRYTSAHMSRYPAGAGGDVNLPDDTFDGLFTVKIVADTANEHFIAEFVNGSGGHHQLGGYYFSKNAVPTGLYILGSEDYVNNGEPFDIEVRRDIYIKSIKLYKGLI